jgi:phosphotriesterase-related protein
MPASPANLRPVVTVLGEVAYPELGITDAHNHVWIERVPGADLAAPVLDQFEPICAELREYHAAGGGALLDCQPGGCGRDANRLIELARASGVHLIAATGFHRKKYYPPEHWLFVASEQQAADYFIGELTSVMEETRRAPQPARAGFIKLALEAAWNDTPQAALEASAHAARQTGATIAIHTEKGALAEKAVYFYEERGVSAGRLVLCHMDKRPDFGLHAELARCGALLEYDTFYRPKYDPEARLWPLIVKMAAAGLAHAVALATDMAEAELFQHLGGGPGLASLPGSIRLRLADRGIAPVDIQQMIGGNITRRLAGLS